jgi:fructoselysine-6-P-deglycase FrlB-like protein
VIGYIDFTAARTSQAEQLGVAIERLRHQVGSLADAGALTGAGPVFLGIGASLAAAAGPVWQLRENGVDAWRLGAGDTPVPLPASAHPIVAISQSGRSAETIAALESVPPGLRWAIVNTAPSPLAALADRLIELGSIPDSYASTIGYTATVAALSLLAESWNGGTPDASWQTFAVGLGAFERTLPGLLADVVPLFDGAHYVDVVGGGPSTGSAEASALLLREVARIPATGMSTRQYLHGAMESAGGGVHLLFGAQREADMARMLAVSGHRCVLVTSEDLPGHAGVEVVRVPGSTSTQRAILEIAVTQELVQAVAAARGIEIEEFVFHNEDTKVTEQ